MESNDYSSGTKGELSARGYRQFVMKQVFLKLIRIGWVPVLVIIFLAGCGSGGSGGSGGDPIVDEGGPTPGPIVEDGEPEENPPPQPARPTVLSVSPSPGAEDVPIDAVIEMTFDKPMKPESFIQGLEGNIPRTDEDQFICVDAECKTVRLQHVALFEYGATYTLELQIGVFGVRDKNNLTLAAPIAWSFSTVKAETFVPALGFQRLMIDGLGDKEDSGECTTVALDSLGTVHITYLSVSDAGPMHAYCPAGRDCSLLTSWEIEQIDAQGFPAHGLGRDENMTIDKDNRLHVVYRDYAVNTPQNGTTIDDFEILKYATKVGNQGWAAVKIEDSTDGITDPYVKVDQSGRIHVSYRAKNRNESNGSIVVSLSYATCAQNCLDPASWDIVRVDGGSGVNEFAAPSHIFVTENAVHISYHANQTLKYATCLLSDDCGNDIQKWKTTVVDAPSESGDVGTDSSIAMNSQGVHITYRDNRAGDMKYAFCPTTSNCTFAASWRTAAIDTVGDVGAITQLKIGANGRLHVSYKDRSNNDLKYGTCPAGDCLNPTRWQLYRIDAPGDVGWDAYIALGPDGLGNPEGRVHISYRDHGNEALKYAWGPSPD